MDAGAKPSSTRLTDMVTVRAPAGFGDQVRQAARAEGVRPGALIRQAISERLKRVERAFDTITPQREQR